MAKKDEDFANLTFREFYDRRRNSAAFRDKVQEVEDGSGGDKVPTLKLVSENQWTFGDDSFEAVGVSGARSLVAAYALYRRRVLKAGGTPTAFERPTADGWE